jgi:hypothetical protein
MCANLTFFSFFTYYYSDLLIAHINFSSVIEWLALILIFYPRKGFVGTGAGGSTFNTNLGTSSVNPSINQMSQTSYSNSIKLNNVPPGTGAGININNERRQKPPSIVDVNQANNNHQNAIKSVPISPDYNNVTTINGIGNSANSQNSPNLQNSSNLQNSPNLQNLQNSQSPQSPQNPQNPQNPQKSTIQKQSSFKRFKKKSSPTPLSDSNSDFSNSDTNDGNNKPVYLKRNISISKDGKMVYGETKPLGKVKGAEFVAVEKADPSFIPSYYFSNELKDKSGNVVKIPSMLNEQKFRYDIDDDVAGSSGASGGSNQKGISSSASGGNNDQQGIRQGVVQQETTNNVIVKNNVNDKQDSDDDDDDEFFYAM